MSGMDGARAGARRNAARKISAECPCGRRYYGNGKAHPRSCETHLREVGWPIDDGMAAAIRAAHPDRSAEIIRAVERGLGRIYLSRRAAGDKSEMSWTEYRERLWRLADDAAQGAPGAS